MRLVLSIVAVSMLGLCATAQAGFAPENDVIATAPEVGDATGAATDTNGDTLLAWDERPTETEYASRARWLSAKGELGPIVDLAPGVSAYQPRAAIGPAGRAFVAWRAFDDVEGSDAMGRWVNRDGSLGPLLTILKAEPAPAGGDAVELAVAVDPAGVATVAWRNQSSSLDPLSLRRISPDSSMSLIVPEAAHDLIDLRIAALPSGATLAVWRGNGVEATTIAPDLSFTPQQKISVEPGIAGPELAVDPTGRALVAWRQSPGEPHSLRGRLLGPSGSPSGEELVFDPSGPGSISVQNPVSADSDGDFLVTWSRTDNKTGNGILYARGVNGAGAMAGPAQPLTSGANSPGVALSALNDRGLSPVIWRNFPAPGPNGESRIVDRAGAPSGGIVELLGTGSPAEVGSAPALGVSAFLFNTGKSVLVRRYLEPPLCAEGAAAARQGKPVTVSLSCSGAAIESAQVASKPKHGKLGGFDAAALTVKYTPKAGFAGTDSFTYTAANDGGASTATTVRVRVRKDTVKPRIKRLRFVESKRGDRFVVKVSERARVKLVVDRKGKRKRSVLGRAKSKKASRRAVIGIRGKLARKLSAAGRFRATAIAIDPAGNRSKPKRLLFKTG